jgi:hypothetical protein
METIRVGKWYRVIDGAYKGFIGECISYNLSHDLPIILQDMEFNSKAVRINEIESTTRQPSGKIDIDNTEKN